MASELSSNKQYHAWVKDLKTRVRQTQIKAAVAVNSSLIEFYWSLGADIVEKQKNATWGSGFLKQLSADLSAEFSDMKGFSEPNLRFIKRWYLYYTSVDTNSVTSCDQIEKQAVSQAPDSELATSRSQITEQILPLLAKIPWGHNRVIVTKCDTQEQALFYVRKTIENNWSRSVLTHQIEGDLFSRQGQAITNFKQTLPEPQSDLAQQIIKDPYNFDFLTLTEDYNERELEKTLVEHITKFLLELGAGFAYIGKQVPLQVGERDFQLDLLFYHTRLHCYVVLELKTGDFQPEHAGKLNFYIKAVDEQMRQEDDQPTIGILLCKNKDKLVAEYALSDIHKPMGVSEYQLTQALPENLKPSLPSIEAIEAELAHDFDDESTQEGAQ